MLGERDQAHRPASEPPTNLRNKQNRKSIIMKGFGIFLIIATIVSAVLPFLGRQLVIFAWIDSWGTMIGWVIRGALILLGIILLIAGGKREAA